MANGGAENRAAESKQSSLRNQHDLAARAVENTSFFILCVVYLSMKNEKKIETSNAETVTISRGEYERLQAQSERISALE